MLIPIIFSSKAVDVQNSPPQKKKSQNNIFHIKLSGLSRSSRSPEHSDVHRDIDLFTNGLHLVIVVGEPTSKSIFCTYRNGAINVFQVGAQQNSAGRLNTSASLQRYCA